MKKVFWAGLFLMLAMIVNVHAEEDVSVEGPLMKNQEVENSVQKNGEMIEVIKLNYVNAEDVAKVLSQLFSERAKIIPYKPANSVIIKDSLRVPED